MNMREIQKMQQRLIKMQEELELLHSLVPPAVEL